MALAQTREPRGMLTQAGDAHDRHFFHHVLHSFQTQDCSALATCLRQGFDVHTRLPTFKLPQGRTGRCYDLVTPHNRDLADFAPNGMLVLLSWTYNLDVSYYYAQSYWYGSHWLALESPQLQWCKLNECNNESFRATCRRDYDEICEFYGDAKLPEQVTLLHVACTNELFLEFVRTLLDHGADVNAASSERHLTPLHLASRLGRSKICRLLIERGASLTRTSTDGSTPWHFAAQQRNGKVFQVFLQSQAIVASRPWDSLVQQAVGRDLSDREQVESKADELTDIGCARSSRQMVPRNKYAQVYPLRAALEVPRFHFDGARGSVQDLAADVERRVTLCRSMNKQIQRREQQEQAEITRLENFIAWQQQINQTLRYQQHVMQQQLDAMKTQLQQMSASVSQPHGQQSMEQLRSPSIDWTKKDQIFLPYFDAEMLRQSTNNFADRLLVSSNCFGQLYQSRDGMLAVKVLLKRLLHVPEPVGESLQRLLRLGHPNILQLRGYSAANDQVMLVYECTSKGAMAAVLRDDQEATAFTWKRRLRALCGMAEALDFMHGDDEKPRVFHCDVTSSSVLLTESHESKLIDCGVARFARREDRPLTSSSTFSLANALGTAGHLCPRYCRTLEYDDKTEIYSFGVTMLEVLTGRVQHDRGLDLMVQYVEEPNRVDSLELAFDARAGIWPRSLVSGLARLVRECTYSSRDSARRVGSMRTVLSRLQALEHQHGAQS